MSSEAPTRAASSEAPARADSTVDGRVPVVMLHGFAGTHHAFDGVLAALADSRCRPIALDLPGHGAHGDVRGDFGACVRLVLEESPQRFALCGYSQGGRIALHVALAAPERVSGLVLISTTAGIEDESKRRARLRADAELADRIERAGLQRFIDGWRRQPLFADEPERVRELASVDHRRNSPEGLAAALRSLGAGAMEAVWERLPELSMPAVVLAGERDEKYRGIGERMVALMPQAKLSVLPGGHGLLLESPAAVAAAIEGMINLGPVVSAPRVDS